MFAMWCWPQLFGQPLILMWIFFVSESVTFIASTRAWMAAFSPIELVIPSLQLSVPGQLSTSVIVCAPASARPSDLSCLKTS